MEIIGKVVRLGNLIEGQSARGPWRKQDLIIETEEQYPRTVCLTSKLMKPRNLRLDSPSRRRLRFRRANSTENGTLTCACGASTQLVPPRLRLHLNLLPNRFNRHSQCTKRLLLPRPPLTISRRKKTVWTTCPSDIMLN